MKKREEYYAKIGQLISQGFDLKEAEKMAFELVMA